MTAQVRAIVIGSAIPWALTACELPFGTDGERVLGIVEWASAEQASAYRTRAAEQIESGSFHDDPSTSSTVVAAPDTVDAGIPFQATVTTFGANGCWKADGANVDTSANLVEVVPYDLTGREEGYACTDELVDLPRTVTITFAEPGDAILRVKGRRVVDGDYRGGTPATVEKQIVVR